METVSFHICTGTSPYFISYFPFFFLPHCETVSHKGEGYLYLPNNIFKKIKKKVEERLGTKYDRGI